MLGSLHAVLLIGVLVVSLVAVVFLERRMASALQALVALLVSLLAASVACLFSAHLCKEGNPFAQWLLPAPAALLVLMFVKHDGWRRLIGATALVATVGLSFHFSELVHRPGYTGNPKFDVFHAVAIAHLTAAKEYADEVEHLEAEAPAGWLRDHPGWPELKDRFPESAPPRRIVHQTWHSALTGLYATESVSQDYWHPGGTLADALRNLEVRHREMP